MRFVRTF